MADGGKLDTLFYELEARTDKFDAQLAAARKSIRDFSGQKDSKVAIDADTAPLAAKVRQVKKDVADIGGTAGKPTTITITANISGLESQLADAKRLAAELGATRAGKPLVARLDAQIAAFESKIARAKSQLDALSTKPKSVQVDAQIAGFQASIKKLSVDMNTFASNAAKKLDVSAPIAASTSAVKEFADNFEVAGRSVGGSAEKIAQALTNPYVAVAALATAVAGLTVAATGVAATFDTEFRKVQASLPTDVESSALGVLRKEIVTLSQVSPRTTTELNNIAGAIAKMGAQDTETVAANLRTVALVGDALSSTDLSPLAEQLDLIGDAFGLSAEGARQAFVQIAAMTKGKIQLEELSGVLGKSATRMSALGVTAQEAAAAMTVLVDAGINSRQITTGLVDLLDKAGSANRAAIDAATAGKGEDAKALRLFGATVTESNIASKGLVGTLAELFKAFDGSRARFQAAGLSLNDFQIAAKAAEASASGASTQVLSYADSLAKLGPAAELNRTSAAALAQILKNELAAQLIDLGNVFLPTVNRGLQLLVDLFSEVRKQAKQTAADLPVIQDLVDRGRTGFAVKKAQPTIAAINNTPGFLEGFDVAKLRDLQGLFRALQNAGEGSEGLNKALATVETRLASLTQGAARVSAAMDDPKKAFEENTRAAAAAAEKLASAREAFERMLDTLGNASEAERASRAIDEFAAAQLKAGVNSKLVAERVTVLRAELARSNADKAAKEMRTFSAALEENAVVLADLMRAELDRQAAAKQARKETEAEIALAALKVEALRTGTAEAERAVVAAEKALVVDRARAAAAKENGANETSIAMAGNLAARLFDAGQNARDLQNAVSKLGEGDIAGKLAGVASQFTQIAISMGEAGKNIGKVAGILGPLLSGVSGLGSALTRVATNEDGSVKKDGAGNAITESLGFLSTISGKNGASQQAKAIAASFAIATTAFQVADALDLFGTRAKQRAKEIAEAAVRFNAALADFVAQANPTTGAAARIRELQKQAADLQKQAVESVGGKFTNGGPSTATSAGLASEAARFRAAAAELGGGKNTAKLAENLRTLAGRYDELSAALQENEAAARAQVLANIEDLGVRKLVAAGLTTEAAARKLEIENQRAIAIATRDTTEEGKEYLKALRDIQQAEAAAAAETARRAQIQQQLADDDAILGGTTTERLNRKVKAFGDTFAQFGTIFDGIDLSTRDGLTQAKATLRGIYESLAKDGIDDLERPIVEFIKSFIGDFDNALSSLPDVLDPIATALEAFNERVRVFGTSLPQQLDQLRTIFSGKFGDLFDEILTRADLGTDAGRASFKQDIEAQIAGILNDGVISAAEKPLYEYLVTLLGLADKAIDDAIATVEASCQRGITGRAERSGIDIQLNDLTGADAFTANIAKYTDAFRSALGVFDVTSVAGVEAATGRLRDLYASIGSLSDAEIMTKFGMTRDELVAAITDVDTGLDGLGQALQDLAVQQADFLDQINLAYYDAFGQGLDAVQLQTEIWVAQMIATAKALGVYTDELAAKIAAIGDKKIQNFKDQQTATSGGGGGTVSSGGGGGGNYVLNSTGITAQQMADMTPQERAAYYEEQAVAGFYRTGAANGQVQAMPQPTLSQAPQGPTQRDEFVASDITRISSTEALRMTDYLSMMLIEERRTAAGVEALQALFGAVLSTSVPSLEVPTLPRGMGSFSAGGGGGGFTAIVNIYGGGASGEQNGRQAAESLLPYLDQYLARAAGIQARNAGIPFLS